MLVVYRIIVICETSFLTEIIPGIANNANIWYIKYLPIIHSKSLKHTFEGLCANFRGLFLLKIMDDKTRGFQKIKIIICFELQALSFWLYAKSNYELKTKAVFLYIDRFTAFYRFIARSAFIILTVILCDSA